MVLKHKYGFLSLFMVMISFAVIAQEELKHLVKSGETLSGIAKQYHTTVGDIMRLNGMTSRTILQIGKTIKIPAAASAKTKPATTKSAPVSSKDMDAKIHVVGPKETLYSISKKYAVTVAQLKLWNDLRNDVIQENQKLIIIPQSKDQASKNTTETEINTPQKVAAPVVQQTMTKQTETKSTVTKAPEKQTTNIVQQPTANKSTVSKPAGKPTVTAVQQSATASTETKSIAINPIPESQSNTVFQQQTPASTETRSVAVPKKDTVQPTVVADKTQTKNAVPATILPSVSSSDIKTDNAEEEEANFNVKNIGDEGYFAAQFQKGKTEVSGDASTFKTASGWLDKKYYILINSIDAGTIVRITVNRKTVYAKVLGPLPDVKEDYGLLLRISNAAATVLGVPDSKFSVKINY